MKSSVIILFVWAGLTKKWNCLLLFVTNFWCSHFFLQKRNFLNSQARKKTCFFWKPFRFVYFRQLWNKKCFIVLRNNIVVLMKRKKTSDLVCSIFVSFILESWEKTTLKKTKQKSVSIQRQVFSVLFLAIGKLCLKQNDKGFVFLLLFVNQKR